jgi:hydrogenase maturation protease
MTAGSLDVPAPTLVLGLGNLLLGDDGVGLRLLEELRLAPGAAGAIDFVDGGTQGLALLGYLANRPQVMILDAVGLGAPPGTVHVLGEGELEQLRARCGATAHEGNGLEILAVARLLGQAPGRVRIVGVEPAQIRTGVGLSAAVESALPEALAAAQRVLADIGRGEHVSGSSGKDC